MLPAEASRAYNSAAPLRIVLWQHVDDLWLLSGFTKEMWPACLLAIRLATTSLPPLTLSYIFID